MSKYEEMATTIIEKVGGKGNISNVLHCVTRLRFNLKDQGVINEEEIKRIKGVIGCQYQGGQFQVIIGPDVYKVYDVLCKQIGFNGSEMIDENLDEKPKEKLTIKKVFSNILDTISGSLTPIIPGICGAAFFKMLVVILGPMMSGVLKETDSLYILLSFVGDTPFYFLPVILGYTSAKKMNCSPILGMILGGIMLHPTFVALTGQSFDVYGIPCLTQSYASTLIPIIASVWIMSYIERFFNNHLPASVKLVFSPAITIAIMLPITLCIIGPAGAILGNYITQGLFAVKNVFGPIGVALVAALYIPLVLTGMHILLVTQLITSLAQGTDPYIFGAAFCSVTAEIGMLLAVALKTKNPDTRTVSLSCLITQIIGGVGEPALYGIALKYKKPLLKMCIAAGIGGLFIGLFNVTAYNAVIFSNIFGIGAFIGGGTSNLIYLAISISIAGITGFLLTYKFGYTSEMDTY